MDSGYVCAVCDVDGMENENARRGYEGGDRLLEEIFSRLEQMSALAVVERLGGDEFSVAQRGVDISAFSTDVCCLTGKIKDELRASVSVGIAKGKSMPEAKRGAFRALFYSKRYDRQQNAGLAMDLYDGLCNETRQDPRRF